MAAKGSKGSPSSAQVLDEDSKDVATAAASALAMHMTVNAIEATAGAVGGGQTESVAGAIAQVIVENLWDAIFPSASVAITIEEMREVVKQDLQQDTLDQINGVLKDLFDMLTKDYTQDKIVSDLTDQDAKERLHDFLQRLNERLVGVIGTLMQDNYAKIGLSTFILLAGFRLALYQEMANVDPDNEDPDFNPTMSVRYATPKTGLVAQYAEKYAKHVEKWWPQVLEDRRKACVAKSHTDSTGTVMCFTEWVEDYATGKDRAKERSYTSSSPQPKPPLDKWLEEYRQHAADKLAEKFNYPEEITANWRVLIDMPINIEVDDSNSLQMAARGLTSSARVLNENTKDAASKAASALAKQMTKKALKATAGATGTAVGGAVAGAIASVIVSGLWDLIFPSESEASITIDEIRSVVKQELQEKTLIEIRAVLHDLSDMLSINYTQNKINKDLTNYDDRKDLHDTLERFDERLIGVIGTLVDKNYAKIGLSTFLLLAGFRLALYQEMANVDPDNKDPDLNPAKSPRYATPKTGLVAQYAKKYYEHVTQWWPHVLEDRVEACISKKRTRYRARKIYHTEWIDDDATGKKDIHKRTWSHLSRPPQPPMSTLLADYRQKAAVKLTEKLNHPMEIAGNWWKLIDQPINMEVED